MPCGFTKPISGCGLLRPAQDDRDEFLRADRTPTDYLASSWRGTGLPDISRRNIDPRSKASEVCRTNLE